MKNWNNNMFTGMITGLISPPVAFSLYVFIFRNAEKVVEVLDSFIVRNVLSHVISLSVIPNLLIFFLFLWAGKERSAFGVIGATIIYALIVAGIIFL